MSATAWKEGYAHLKPMEPDLILVAGERDGAVGSVAAVDVLLIALRRDRTIKVDRHAGEGHEAIENDDLVELRTSA